MTPEDLLLARRLIVGNESLRIVEVERYRHSADDPDPYPHKHPLQLTSGLWAFHRVGSGYRGGTYKGLDLTCGDGTAFGGLLLRAVEDQTGRRTDGPSRVVDRLLTMTGTKSVAELDRRIDSRPADDLDNPLGLLRVSAVFQPVYHTARVGLTFADEHLRYWARPERFLINPRRTRTGRPQLIVGLFTGGMTASEIVAATGSPAKSVTAYLAAFVRGRTGEPPAPTDTGSSLLCHRLGRALFVSGQ